VLIRLACLLTIRVPGRRLRAPRPDLTLTAGDRVSLLLRAGQFALPAPGPG